MKIIFDTNKIKVEYNPYVGKVRALYNSYIHYIIWYCIKHKKHIPTYRKIGHIIHNLPDVKKELFYTQWEIAKIKYELNELNKIIR